MELKMDLEEVVEQTDAVFVGKVTMQTARHGAEGKMIFTDVTFVIDNWVGGRVAAPGSAGTEVVLTFAGGQIGEETVKVSGVPELATGSTYVIFTRMDGQVYASPLIGGTQGLFPVITDDTTGKVYPLTYGRQYVAGFTERDFIRGIAVDRIAAGKVVPRQTESRFTRNLEAPRAVAPAAGTDAAGSDGSEAAPAPTARASATSAGSLQPPVTLETFVDHIKSLLVGTAQR
jgi:hypothetical protein